jgi:phage gpG-like protein
MTISDNSSVLMARLKARIEATRPDSPVLREAIHKIGMVIVAKTKMNMLRPPGGGAPIGDRGTLRESIQYRFAVEGDTSVLKVGSFGVRYAALHEFGGPFTARMRRAMFASMRRRGGPERPSKGVIVGNRFRARPYLRPAVESSRDFIVSTLREALKK